MSKTTVGLDLRKALSTLGPLLGLVFVSGLFAFSDELRPVFYTGANWKNILTQTVIVGIGALGMTLIIISGGIDLSVGSVVALSSVVGARLLAQQQGAFEVVLACLGVGALVGLLNGAVIAGFGMLPFVVTLGMMGIARGVAKWLADNQTVNFEGGAGITALMEKTQPDQLWPLPPGVWIALALTAAVWALLNRTVFGRHIFAIGSNEATARLCGIPVRTRKILTYGLAGVFFGAAGLMQLSRLAQGDPSVAIGLELDMIAAVVIGGASLNGGVGSVAGSVTGALIMAVLRSGSSQMNWPNYVQEIIIGVVIILAVGLDRFRQGRSAH
ncbi:MAG: ABC transporter permease [Verrucomicrobia bacterium]|nr:ABC transporter permease [Verrucomicrobiota bacterium]